MTKITLNTLSLRNFKGCAALTLRLDGRSASIYGDNAAGKTTIYDALTWLLFGKDSSGASKFNIKPLSHTGEVLDHAATTAVKAEFDVNGQTVTLERTYFELWSKKRGRSESTFDGHSSEFFYNGLPVQKTEFSERVKALCDESTFRTLTDLRWFCAGESEQNRRSVLFDLIGGVSEEDVLASDPIFKPLSEAVGFLTVEEYRTAAQKQRKSLNTKAKTTPARIDEQKRTIAEYAQQDYEALRQKREALFNQREQAQQNLSALRNEDGAALLIAQRDGARAKLDALEAKNTAHRSAQSDPMKKQLLEGEISQLRSSLTRMADARAYDTTEKERLEKLVIQYRETWGKKNSGMKNVASLFFVPGVCPTCGQALPKDEEERQRKLWEAEREERLRELKTQRDACSTEANACKERIANLEEGILRWDEELKAAQSRLDDAMGSLADLNRVAVTDLPDYLREKAALTHTIVELEEQIGRIRQDSSTAIAEARQKFNDTCAQLNRLDGLLAGETVLNNAQKRMEELLEEQKKIAEETERLDMLLDLCDRFTRAKAEYIDNRVNGLFSRVRWQLFEEQINGGLKDCCKATVDGVPYADLNTGAQINAGLDVIETLSREKGIRVPLFVDNAESVTRLKSMATQIIRLVVSAEDQTLRVEPEV